MNKRGLIALLAVLLFPLVVAITGESITGEVSDGPTDVSVFVDQGPPVIYIHSPLNITYVGTDFLLNYSIRNDLNQSWYNLDNGANISLGSLNDNSLTLSAALGVHTIYLYANNSLGENSKNVSFILSLTPPSSSSSSSSSGGSSSGGGSSGGGAPVQTFTFNEEVIEVSLIQGESKKQSFEIENIGRRDLSLSLEFEDLENFAIADETQIILGPGETKLVEVNFFSLSTFPPGIYVGKINAFEGNARESLVVIIEIKLRVALFDVGIEILKRDKQSLQGDEISAIIELTNIGLRGTAVDVELVLSIVDLNKDLIKEYSKEILAVKDELAINRKLQLPAVMADGTYLLVADLKYNNISATSYDSFEIVENKPFNFLWFLIILIFILLAVIIAIIVSDKIKKNKRAVKNRQKSLVFYKPSVKEE